jgi:hypothetical protein
MWHSKSLAPGWSFQNPRAVGRVSEKSTHIGHRFKFEHLMIYVNAILVPKSSTEFACRQIRLNRLEFIDLWRHESADWCLKVASERTERRHNMQCLPAD